MFVVLGGIHYSPLLHWMSSLLDAWKTKTLGNWPKEAPCLATSMLWPTPASRTTWVGCLCWFILLSFSNFSMSSVAALTSGNDWGVNDQNVNINATNIADLLEAKVRWPFLHKYKHRVALFLLIILGNNNRISPGRTMLRTTQRIVSQIAFMAFTIASMCPSWATITSGNSFKSREEILYICMLIKPLTLL